MISKLRKRFVLFAMAAVTVLLVVLVAAINGMAWWLLDRQSEEVMHTLVNANGTFAEMDFRKPPMFMPPLDMDQMQAARFFMVHANKEGDVVNVNVDQISSIDRIQAEKYAGDVIHQQKLNGKIDVYKYSIKQFGEDILIFFMDVSGQRNVFLTVLFASVSIAVCCWLIVLLFVVFLSGKVVRPIMAGMEKQKQFITNAGHELKTPLTIIQSNNDAMMLIHGENKYNNNIKIQIKRLSTLMNNLLTLSRLDEEIKLPMEYINISCMLEEIFPVYREEAEKKNIIFTAEIIPQIQMKGNRDMLIQLFTIILDNAIKYTTCDGKIYLGLKHENRRVIIMEENDCSPELAVGDPERLFERFYRGDSARTQRGISSGYGIGLSAARAITESFGGKITAEFPDSSRVRFTLKFKISE